MAKKKEILTGDMKESLRESFAHLRENVPVLVFTQKGKNEQYSEILREFLVELGELEPRIKVEFHPAGGQLAEKHRVSRVPTVLIRPDKYGIRFTGAPLGEEGQSFVFALIMASTGSHSLSEDSVKRLDRLSTKRHVRVFTSPT